MREGLFSCWVCVRTLPAALMHTHHRWPQAAGGSDDPGNLCNLCPLCHNSVDRGASLVSKGRTGEAKAFIEQYLPDLDSQARLAQLVNTQAHAWVSGKPSTRRVVLSLDQVTYNHLKMLANLIQRPTKTGKLKPMGVSEYMSRVLTRHVEDKAREGLVPNDSEAKKD